MLYWVEKLLETVNKHKNPEDALLEYTVWAENENSKHKRRMKENDAIRRLNEKRDAKLFAEWLAETERDIQLQQERFEEWWRTVGDGRRRTNGAGEEVRTNDNPVVRSEDCEREKQDSQEQVGTVCDGGRG